MVENFDAYGERLPDGARSDVGKSRSAVFARIGQGIFWAVVIVVVLARLFFFSDPVFEAPGAQDATGQISR